MSTCCTGPEPGPSCSAQGLMCTRPCSFCQGPTPLGEGQGLLDYLRPARLGPGTPSCLAHGTGPTLQLAWKHLKNVASCPPGSWTLCAIPHWLFSVYIISLRPRPGLLPPSGHHLALTLSSDRVTISSKRDSWPLESWVPPGSTSRWVPCSRLSSIFIALSCLGMT